MKVYMPTDYTVLGQLIFCIVLTLICGFLITRIKLAGTARIAAWVLVIFSVSGAERLCSQEHSGFRMLVIIIVLLYAMKTVVSVESQAAGEEKLSLLRWMAFTVLWFGMRPRIFAGFPSLALSGARQLIYMGIRRLIAGCLFIGAAWFTGKDSSLILSTILLLTGLSLLLHFGIFNITAGIWRLYGVSAQRLFRAPLSSKSLTQFWGRRWNLAYSEMTSIAVYRPLARRYHKACATACAFFFSGLLHELAISVPVKAGYGLPLLYFLIQGMLMALEQYLDHLGRPIDRIGWIGQVWTLFWLIVPLPLLFHLPFLRGIVWPIVGINQ